MKIVHLCRRYLPDRGGVETHVSQLNQVWLQRGHQISVLTEQSQPAQQLTEKIEKVSISRLPLTAAGQKIPTWQWLWSQREQLFQADVIHVHDIFWWLWPVLPLVWHKVHITFHGWEGQFPVRWQAKLQRLVAALFSRSSIHIGAWIQEFYWDKPTAVLYSGVAKDKVQIPVKKVSKKTALEIVFLGRLEPENEVLQYIEVIKHLHQSKFDFSVQWVGFGSLETQCKKYGTVTGEVTSFQPFLAQSDLVWSSSYLSILEAQAAGKIVCALYSHPLKQRYLETNPGSEHMVLKASAKSMAEQILLLHEKPSLRADLQQAAYDFAKTQTWEKVAGVYQQNWRFS